MILYHNDYSDFNVCDFDYQAKRLTVKVKVEKEGEVEVSLVRF